MAIKYKEKKLGCGIGLCQIKTAVTQSRITQTRAGRMKNLNTLKTLVEIIRNV